MRKFRFDIIIRFARAHEAHEYYLSWKLLKILLCFRSGEAALPWLLIQMLVVMFWKANMQMITSKRSALILSQHNAPINSLWCSQSVCFFPLLDFQNFNSLFCFGMKGNSGMLSLLFGHIGAAEAENDEGLKFFSVGHYVWTVL